MRIEVGNKHIQKMRTGVGNKHIQKMQIEVGKLMNTSMDECNTIPSAYTSYRHLAWYWTHPSTCR